MPTTRKSARTSSGAGKQSTLSFNNRVTKPVPKSGKDAVINQTTPSKPSPLRKAAQVEEDGADDSTLIADPEEPEIESELETKREPEAPQKSETEIKAEKVSTAQINNYWKKLEGERKAKRVHQEELSTGEKVLRYFDVSSQYGVSRPGPDLQG